MRLSQTGEVWPSGLGIVVDEQRGAVPEAEWARHDQRFEKSPGFSDLMLDAFEALARLEDVCARTPSFPQGLFSLLRLCG